jgi:Cu-Zn family superoxide dismutase
LSTHQRILLAVLGLVALMALTVTAVWAAPPPPPSAAVTLAWGTFERFTPSATAVTYSPSLVPEDARISVVSVSGPHGTLLILAPHGLLPNREYGAHVHARTCGALPSDSGAHFQNVPDPFQPSVDQAYANPANEIWLDFTTDAAGNAIASSTVDWTFAGRDAHSVVIHEHHTHTGTGQAGTAGSRLACLKANFK